LSKPIIIVFLDAKGDAQCDFDLSGLNVLQACQINTRMDQVKRRLLNALEGDFKITNLTDAQGLLKRNNQN